MAMAPHHQFQQSSQQQQHQQQQSKPFNKFCSADRQISPPGAYFNGHDLPDQSQHPPYIPPFHVAGFAPCPVPAAEGSDGGVDLQWNYGLEPRRKRLKEQDFLENNSQISSVDILQPRSISTGVGLPLDNGRLASSGESPFLGVIGDDIDRELRQHDAEIDRFLRVQAEQLRREVLEKVQANQLHTISYVEQKVIQKLREKEEEVENINKKNLELELRMEQLAMEAGMWQQRAKYNENMLNTLSLSLQQIYAQSRDSKEGCGDSEIDDTASCCNGQAINFHFLCKEKNVMKRLMTCKVCKANEVCMLLLPCKHLCLCKDCESRLSVCPMCQSSKIMGLEVYV